MDHTAKLTVLAVSLFLLCCIHKTTGYTSMAQLDGLLQEKKQNYNKLLRPIFNQSEPLLVQMAFDLIAIRSFDEVAEKFSVVGTVYMIWKDEHMPWEPKDVGNLYTFIIESGDYWTPPFIIVNAFEKFETVGQDSNWPIRFYYTGDAIYHPGQVFTTTCSVDVTYYPWDTQICTILFTVWGHGPEEIVLLSYANSTKVSLTYFSENGEWDLLDTAAGAIGTDVFHFTFIMKRKPLFIVLNTLIPIVLMSILNIIAFLIPIDSGERISYSITVLLAVAVFLTLIGDTMPRSGTNIAILCVYLVCVLALSVFIIFTSVLSMRIHSRSDNCPVSCVWQAFTNFVTCRKCCRSNRSKLYQRNGRIQAHTADSKHNVDYTLYLGKREQGSDGHHICNPNNINMISTAALEKDPIHVATPFGDSVAPLKAGRPTGVNGTTLEEHDNEVNNDSDEITWKDVSVAMDIVFGVFSLICLVAFTVFFFVYTIQHS